MKTGNTSPGLEPIGSTAERCNSEFMSASMEENHQQLGIVVIGRNEAPRLATTLSVFTVYRDRVVYVDSDSHDGSANIAEGFGVNVVRITEGRMSAARGRRLGLQFLMSRFPELQFVQFVDGDCEVTPGWLSQGMDYLTRNAGVAAVVGTLTERHANASLLLRVAGIDWELSAGETDVIGGISMMRVCALLTAGNWSDKLIAGEELDLSVRLREAGYTLQRLPEPMCVHDMGVSRVSEFWHRSIRSGFAYAQLSWLHGQSGPRRWRMRTAGAMVYGLLLPATVVSGWLWHWSVSVLGGAGIASLLLRLFIQRRRRGDPNSLALAYSLMTTVCKSAYALGVLRFAFMSLRGATPRIIEYKQTNGKRS